MIIYVDFKNKKVTQKTVDGKIKKKIDVKFYLTQPNPNGEQDLLVVDNWDQIIDQCEGACFGYMDSGTNYAGWGQVEYGYFVGYDDNILMASNHQLYECGCEECEKAHKEKDYNKLEELDHDKGMFDYISECGEFGEPLIQIDKDQLGDYINKIKIDQVLEFVMRYLTQEELELVREELELNGEVV